MSEPESELPLPQNRPQTDATLDEPYSQMTPPDTRLPNHSTLPPEASGATPMPALGGGSRYRTTRLLGRGGLGEVFVAIDEELQREVALKEIQARHVGRTESRRRFILEAEVTGRLEHPGIVPIYGLGAYADGRPYYAMRFIRGDSYEQAITRFHAENKTGADPGARTLAFRDLLRRFTDVCNAVAYAHSKGVLHRDLKPANVMLGTFGETLVVDWGLAKVLHAPDETASRVEAAKLNHSSVSLLQTLEGSVVGTPAYMSPEQAAGATATLGPATDVYSLGAILYHLLTGDVPVTGSGDVMDLLKRVQQGDFPPPRRVAPSTPVVLEAICLKAMALQPEDRYGTAKELAEDVDHWLADEPVTAHREALPARVRRWGRRHRALVSSLVALLVTLVASLTVDLWRVNAEKQQTLQALEQVQAEKEEKQEALDRSQKAEKSAAEQRKLALQTVRVVVDKIDARLKDKPALQDLRKELLKQAMEGLKKVAPAAAETSGQIDHATIWVHIELGDIFLYLDGATAEAKTEYELAQNLASQLAGADSKRTQSQRDLSVVDSRVGDVLLRQGDAKGALAAYRQGLEIDQRLADADPKSARAQSDLSVSHERIGNVLLQQGDAKEALAVYRQGLEARQRLAEANPKSTTAQRDLSVSQSKVGDVLLRQGDTKSALAAYRKGLEIDQRQADADPQSAQAQRDLAVSQSKVGDVLLRQGETTLALEAYRKAQALQQQLSDADPKSATAQSDLSVSHERIGNVLLQQGDAKEALAAYRQGLEVRQRLAVADPKSALAQRDLLVSLFNLGNVAQQIDEFAEAADWYDKALAVPKRFEKPEVFEKDIADLRLRERLVLCRAAAAVVVDVGAIAQQPEMLRGDVLYTVVQAHVHHKDAAKALAAADRLALLAAEQGELYNAACCFALCVALADKPAEKEQYAARAVGLLKRAVARGYKDAAHMKKDSDHMKKDSDLDSLRARDDFKALMKELEPK